MMKIAVVEGEDFLRYFREEMPVVEAVGIKFSEVGKYVGQVEIIVVGGYDLTIREIDRLRREYPEQEFVGFEPQMADLIPVGIERMTQKVLLIATETVRGSIGYRIEKSRLELSREVSEMDCTGWATGQKVQQKKMERALAQEQEREVNVALVYDTRLHDCLGEMGRLLGWQAMVIDDFQRVGLEVCRKLGLRGVRKRFR